MSRHYQVVPECYADTVLVEILGFKNPNHQLGIGKVFKSLSESLEKRPAVGIIDDDKEKGKHLDTFELKETCHSIKRMVKGKHTILVISPAFEEWVFENAQNTGTNPAKFGFSSPKAFQKASKKVNVSQNHQVKQFLNTLKQKQAPGFIQLTEWICEAAGINESDLA